MGEPDRSTLWRRNIAGNKGILIMLETDKKRSNSGKSILSNPEDINCIIFHLVTLFAYGLAFWLYLHPEVAHIQGLWSRIAFVLASAVMLGWISGIDIGVNFHNHVHRKIFRVPWLNIWFGRLWTFSGGWPSFFWEYAHVTVHHADTLGATDWTVPKRRPDNSFENIYWYCLLHWPWRYTIHLWQDFRSGRGGAHVGQKAIKEFAIFLTLWSIPLLIDPVMSLGLWVLPHYLANVLTMGMGMYVQHIGCVEASTEHPYRHSNTFLSPMFNLTMFNIGYHIEHHCYPHIHWSALPACHKRLKSDLINDDASIVPFGFFYGATLFALVAPMQRSHARCDFKAVRHPDYVKPALAQEFPS
ncbi:fatty acid desaturase [Chlorogloeopsis sp. ULAP01]|uniref:fatty acid desaturase family protein n=1 Tax=Chlorogloeopsis sp. ULAP01 TaxID=3056483 RepID=UPI0025AB4308|nr:fatty acid desaturase [Chlorogloeopsis sp. ULAP01]MDM9385360.1 fatty acid desaturase [Chlorogloeopsis sp. ULAP01]